MLAGGMKLTYVVLALLLAIPLPGAFRAGAAYRVITPNVESGAPAVYIAGFGHNRVATGIHDPLFVRCLAMATGKRPVVLCGVDLIGLFLDDVEKIRQGARQQVGRDLDVIISATHGHEGPDTMGLWGPKAGVSGLNEPYNQYVVQRSVEAVVAAVRGMKRAQLFLARTGFPDLKSFIHDTRPPVVHDPELIALTVKDRRQRTISTLINWANHPEALGSANTLITSDYPAAFYRVIETLRGGTAVFMNGAVGGMQSPLGAQVMDPTTREPAPKNSFRFAETIGERLADLAHDALNNARPTKIDRIEYSEKRVMIPVANEGFRQAAAVNLYGGRKAFRPDGTSETVVGYLKLARGNDLKLEAAMIPGELYPELSVGGVEKYAGADFPEAPVEPAIKQQMRAPYRMLFGLANDEIGYIIPKSEWDNQAPWLQDAPKRWYGEVNSIGPEAAPIIAAAFAALAKP
jgi:hypothetical protein